MSTYDVIYRSYPRYNTKSNIVTYGDTQYYYLYNLQGDVTGIYNSQGSSEVKYTYGAMVTEWGWHNKWFDFEEKHGYNMFKSNCEHVDLDMYPLENSECPFWQFVGTGIARIGERIC